MPRVTSKLEIEQIEERRYAPLFDCHREGDRSVDNMMVQIGYVLRIFFAGICGLMIGIERRNRLKEAGIRTHLIVALAKQYAAFSFLKITFSNLFFYLFFTSYLINPGRKVVTCGI